MTVEQFAAILMEQRRARLKADYPNSPQWEWEVVQVVPGPKYTKVDVGPTGNVSGKYMIENATGVIYGIKGYGRVHKGHVYGTLDTVNDWYWGGYVGVRRALDGTHPAEPKPGERKPVDPDLFKRTAPRWNCVDFPNDGPHYTPDSDCAWCGMTREQIAAEYKAAGRTRS